MTRTCALSTFALLSLSLPLFLAGCGSPAPRSRPTAPMEDTTAAPAPTEAAPTEAPETAAESPARTALAWILEVLNERNGAVDKTDVGQRFAPTFLAQVPAEQVIQIFAALSQQMSPATVTSVDDGETELLLSAVLDTKAGPVKVILGLEAAEPHRFETLLFKPAAKAEPTHETFEEAATALAAVGAKTTLYAARVEDDGACAPVFEQGSDRALAIGSAFKLYVLAALVEEIEAGKISWDQEIEVTDAVKSLPSGELHKAPAGSKVSVAKAAEAMISISDNTATDMLIALVGRKRVEKTARKLGNSRNEPFFTTRELFLLKLVVSDADRSRYGGKRKVARRSYLNGPLSRKKLPSIAELDPDGWDKPRDIETLEWFATAPELCSVMSFLMKKGAETRDEVLRGILSKNPGMAVDTDQWGYVAFKGGSEPGVFNLTFLLVRRDGQVFSLVVGVNDAASAFDQAPILQVAGSAVSLLGQP